MDRIELEAKSDRELLLLVAGRTNDVCEDVREVKATLRAQNGRLRAVEDWRNWLTGGMALLAIVVLLVAGWALSKL